MPEALGSGAVQTYVVSGPPGPELLAACRQFPDKVGQRLVVRITTGLRPQQRDDVVRRPVPVGPEVPRAGVEEVEPREVRRPGRAGVDGCEEGAAEAVGG